MLFDSMLCLVMAALNRDLSDHRFIQSSAENNQQDDVWKYPPSRHKETVQSDNFISIFLNLLFPKAWAEKTW